MIERAPLPPDSQKDLRESITGIVGWIPDDIFEARRHSVRALEQEAIMILRDAGDCSSPKAMDILRAIKQSRDLTSQADVKLQEIRSQMIDHIKNKSGPI